MSKLLAQKVNAKDILRMIEARMEAVQSNYYYAVNSKDAIKAEAFSETKWQLAELKMQFVDLLSNQLDEQLSNNGN